MAKGNFEDLAPGDFAETSIVGGLPKLVRIWEKSRELNNGGYGSGYLVDAKGIFQAASKVRVTSCSPWTSTVMCMALDPREVDTKSDYSLPGPYVPVFDGGKTQLDKTFNWLHNSQEAKYFLVAGKAGWVGWQEPMKKYVPHVPGLASIKFPISSKELMHQTDWDWVNRSSGSLIALNIAKPVDPKKMRRGDMVGLNWFNGGGHAVFAWNVHVNGAGDVDAFQILASNSGVGVSIYNIGGPDKSGCSGKPGSLVKTKPDVFTQIIDNPEAYPEYNGYPYIWLGLEGVKKANVDLASFGCSDPKHVLFFEAGSSGFTVGSINVSRLNGVTPPEPYLVSGKTPPPPPPVKTPVAKVASKKPPAADAPAPAASGSGEAAKKPANPTAADATEPQAWQLQVELDLRALHTAKWIDADPGDAGSVNDAASQAAIRDYQVKFMNSKAPSLGHADPETRARLCKAAAFARLMPMVNGYLGMLVKAGQLKTAPGSDLLALDEQTRASVKEFQTKHGLGADGIPGPMTQQKLGEVAASLPPAEAPNAKIPPAALAAGSSPASDPANSSTGDAGISLFYWVTNHGAPGQPAKLSIVASPKTEGKALTIGLYNGSVAIDAKVAVATIANGQASVSLSIPAGLAGGSKLVARATGDGGISAQTGEFNVDGASGPASAGKIKSGSLTVGKKDFATWFNTDFRAAYKGKTSPKPVKTKMLPAFDNKIESPAHFKAFFDQMKGVTGLDEVTPLQFAAAFCIPYNETGGTFNFTIEGAGGGGVWLPRGQNKSNGGVFKQFGIGYFFFTIPGYKHSYNTKTSRGHLAGDQMFAKQQITKDQVAVWNGSPSFDLDAAGEWKTKDPLKDPRFPITDALVPALKECDFYKFRGRGFSQTSLREGYETFVAPALKRANMKKLDEITNDELDAAFKDLSFSTIVFNVEFTHNIGGGKTFKDITDDSLLFDIGERFAGRGVGYGDFYKWRVTELAKAIEAAGFTGG